MQPDKPIKKKAPKWLRELQLRSWEPEILLSGIVLYGMFQVPDLLDQAYFFFRTNIFDAGDVENLIALLKVATYWLIFGLILHLISRGIWVGMIGLSFTFPKGINTDDYKVNDKFKDHLDSIPSIQDIIIRLEKVCSSLFSISFMLFMSIIGGYFYLFIALIVPFFGIFFATDGTVNLNDFTVARIYGYIVVVIGLIGLVDFLTLGMLLKRFKWLAIIYYPFYRFISVLTLSKLYRPIYYSIVTNFGKWKIAVFLVFFVLISLWGIVSIANSDVPGDQLSRIEFYANTQGTNAFSGSYNDQNEDIYSIRAQIPSDVISNNTLRLFVIADINIEDSIKKHCDYEKLLEESDTLSAVVKLQCLREFFEIYINDSLVSNYEWRFHYKQETKQRGYLTWIDISNLKSGLYELKVATPEGMSYYPRTRLPFYREENPYYQSTPQAEGTDDNSKQLKSTKPFTVN